MDLTSDERLRLSVTAADRARRQRAWLFGGCFVFVAAVAVLPPIVTGDGVESLLDVALLAVPPVVFLIFIAVFYMRLRRRPQQLPLVVGADRETRAAVRRALQTGYATDRRVDALARDYRDYQLRQLAQILTPLTLAVLACLMLVSFDYLAIRLFGACVLAIVLAGVWLRRRTQRRLASFRGLPDQDPPTASP